MIDQTFTLCPGIGPKTDLKLKTLGFQSWKDCMEKPDDLPFSGPKKESFLQKIDKSQKALKENDIGYFVQNLPSKEHWRILATYFDQATFFDIETTGLSSYDSIITLIIAYHKEKFYHFLFKENLDQFLELVENSSLLVAFNGNSFDIPFVEKAFNIPEIGCPFIDLRWICYHLNYQGGLKSIEKQLGIQRPKNIESIDGFEAVSLFIDWQQGDLEAKDKLIAYCQADVAATYLVANEILKFLGLARPHINTDLLFSS